MNKKNTSQVMLRILLVNYRRKLNSLITKLKYSRRGILIDEDVVIKERVQLSKGVSIGAHSYIGPNSNIRGQIEIGDYFLCADGVCFVGNDHNFEKVGYPIDKSGVPSKKKTIIGIDVWLGHNVTILRGISIGDCAIVAAGSVVTKDIQSFDIVGGVPARSIRKRFESESERMQHLKAIKNV
jgi:acetyltransferase-like isoleucine patch superfamily enzyme